MDLSIRPINMIQLLCLRINYIRYAKPKPMRAHPSNRSRYSLLKAYHTCQTYFHFHGLTPDHIILKSSNGTGATGWRPVTIQTRQPRANSWGLDNFRGFDVYEKASARDAGNDNPAIQEKPTVQPDPVPFRQPREKP